MKKVKRSKSLTVMYVLINLRILNHIIHLLHLKLSMHSLINTLQRTVEEGDSVLRIVSVYASHIVPVYNSFNSHHTNIIYTNILIPVYKYHTSTYVTGIFLSSFLYHVSHHLCIVKSKSYHQNWN